MEWKEYFDDPFFKVDDDDIHQNEERIINYLNILR